MTTIKVTEGVEKLLDALKKEHPELDESALIERALAEYQRRDVQKHWKQWDAGLPMVELSDEEQASLEGALAEADRAETRVMSIEELLDEAARD